MSEHLENYNSYVGDRLEEIKQGVLEGNINPLSALEAHKRMEAYLKEFKASIESVAEDELSKYGEKEVSFGNAKFSISSGGRYSYRHDEEWSMLNKALKEREKQMQTAYKTEGEMVINGEVIHHVGIFVLPAIHPLDS